MRERELILELTGRVSLIRVRGGSSLEYQYNLVPNERHQAIPPIKYFSPVLPAALTVLVPTDLQDADQSLSWSDIVPGGHLS